MTHLLGMMIKKSMTEVVSSLLLGTCQLRLVLWASSLVVEARGGEVHLLEARVLVEQRAPVNAVHVGS